LETFHLKAKGAKGFFGGIAVVTIYMKLLEIYVVRCLNLFEISRGQALIAQNYL
jgi:hypothetical protein